MNSAGAQSHTDRLFLGALIAAALHALLILGVTFDVDPPRPGVQQLEVTLVRTPGRAPRDARHIAAADQVGSGSEALRELVAGESSQPVRPQLQAAPARRGVEPDPAGTRVISSTRGQQRAAESAIRQARAAPERSETDRQLARLDARLAELEAALESPQTPQLTQPRVRRLEAAAAKSAVDAAYLAEWRRRVEAVGNQYYPEASLRYGIYGELRMLVTVRADGSLESIDILNSSGQAVLDEAAVRIVRMAAPFPPFPDALRENTDRLEIVRRWQFEQNPLSSE